jgi:uncharacterized protein YbjT (DUF2867 family)
MDGGAGMRITIFAATGGVGRHLVAQAVAAGHEVTAVARRPDQLADTPARAVARRPDRLAAAVGRRPDQLAAAVPARVVAADLAAADPAVLRAAVAGADAVLSGLGARSAADAEAGIARRGTQAIVQAMHDTGVRRIVVVSAASVGTVASPGRPRPPRYNPGDGFMMRHVIAPAAKRAFRRQYADLARMEDVLRDSGLDWTVSRPPRLLSLRLWPRYRTADGQNVRTGLFIARSDVARHMLAVLEQPETIHRVLGIAY